MVPAEQSFQQLKAIQGLIERTGSLGVRKKDDLPLMVSACEFILDGLYALRKISRDEEKGYFATEKKRTEPLYEPPPGRAKRTYN